MAAVTQASPLPVPDSGPPDRAIAGEGSSEADWQAWPGLQAMGLCTPEGLVSPDGRAVIVSPHPDDEVLAFGGLLAMLAERDGRAVKVRVLAVTEGEASHPGSAQWPSAALAQRRGTESREGLRELGLPAEVRYSLGLHDGQVAAQAGLLQARLMPLLRPGDTVFSTWRWDGHPDHEASAQAVAAACARTGCRHVEAPVWMWHWAAPGDARVPWARMQRLALTPGAMARKARAIAAHATQLAVQDTGAPPVLSATSLQRLMRPFEYFILPEAAP